MQLRRLKLEASVRWKQHTAAASRSSGPRMPIINEVAPEAPTSGNLHDKIHITHKRVAIKNVVFCRRCGYWMQSKPASLSKVCPGKPAHRGAAGKLSRMLKGLRPDTKTSTWPDGTSTSIAVTTVTLDT